jgi:hypothetical protein
MDKQRAERGGAISNVFCTLSLRDEEETVAELCKAQQCCVAQYDGFASCLADPATLHVTLVAAHAADGESLAQLREAFSSFSFAPFVLSLRGLGAWTTTGGRHVLFAEPSEGSDECVRLARALSHHLRSKCGAAPDGSFGAGSWIDVLEEEGLFQPHLSIASVDPAEHPQLVRAMAAKSGTRGGGGAGKKKLSSRDKARGGGGGGHQEAEFGREPALFRSERKAFRKIVFGSVSVRRLCLERGFAVLAERLCEAESGSGEE